MNKLFDNMIRKSIDRTSIFSTPSNAFKPTESEIEELGKSTIIDNVEITPGTMIFNDAYQGRVFKKKLLLRNVGNRTVSIRVGPPSANAFQMKPKPIQHLYLLSPGMQIVRFIHYKFCSALPVYEASLLIFINEKQFTYDLKVVVTESHIKLTPEELDYGHIDVGRIAVQKSVTIKNCGHCGTAFDIKMEQNEEELIVVPEKGYLNAQASVTLKVEVMGFNVGPFEKEFWIKCHVPLRMRVFGEFITPTITSIFPSLYYNIAMIQFSRIYIGMERSKVILIKNISSTDVMFCITGNSKKPGQEVLFGQSTTVDGLGSECFQICPVQGRLYSNQTAIIKVTFRPISLLQEFYDECAVSFIEVRRINCSDINRLDYKIDTSEQVEFHAVNKAGTPESSLLQVADPYDELRPEPKITCEDLFLKHGYFKVCLYGEMEAAKICIRPSSINLNQIKTGEVYKRELRIKNCSMVLPVQYRYKREFCVDIYPESGILAPAAATEATITINANRAGFFHHKIEIELLSAENGKTQAQIVGMESLDVKFSVLSTPVILKPKFNMGITPLITHEVGIVPQPVKFNTKFKLPRQAIVDKKLINKTNNLIAFPSDRPKSTRRANESLPCLTICAKIPRIAVSRDEFTLTRAQSAHKHAQSDYWMKFIRHEFKKPKPIQKSPKLPQLAIQSFKCEGETVVLPKRKLKDFVPLSPMELHRIKITPLFIRLQKVAPRSQARETFTVENTNEFSIHVLLTSIKSGITFPRGNEKEVAPNEKITVLMKWSTGGVGKCINQVEVVINYCHLFKISVMVEVIPKSVDLEQTNIVFNLHEATFKFLELSNNLNSSISFEFIFDGGGISSSRYSVFPETGIIPAKRNLLCWIKYEAKLANDRTEAMLISEGGSTRIINIMRKKAHPNVQIQNAKEVDFGRVPANMAIKRNFCLRNQSQYKVCFTVTAPPGVTVTPLKGIINQKSDKRFTVSLCIPQIIEFRYPITICIDDSENINVTISGLTILPEVLIKPSSITNRKLIPYSINCSSFSVKNQSDCECYIKFHVPELSDFTITPPNDPKKILHNTNIKLVGQEEKFFNIAFFCIEASSISYYLPIVVNNIFGPPNLRIPDSLKPKYYVNISTESELSSLGVPKRLPLLKIINVSTKELITFSSVTFTFDQYNKFKEEHFVTTNTSRNETLEVCLRIETLSKTAFTVAYSSGEPVTEHAVSLVFKLNPGQSTTLAINFNSTYYSEFTIDLPIYVRNYQNGAPFNHLRLIGRNLPPKMIPSMNTVVFESIPLRVKGTHDITLTMKYHKSDCILNSSYQETSFMDVYHYIHAPNVYKVLFSIVCHFSAAIKDDVVFTCTCGASCTILVRGNSENCVFTHHSFFMINLPHYQDTLSMPESILGINDYSTGENSGLDSMRIRQRISITNKSFDRGNNASISDLSTVLINKNKSCFPEFPCEEDKSVYAQHMRSTLQAVENWLFTQGFYKRYSFEIPFTFAMQPTDTMPNYDDSIKKLFAKKETHVTVDPYLMQLLFTIRGSGIRNELITCAPEKNTPGDVALHFLNVYTNMLVYLDRFGSTLVHVLPEYLLTYDQYLIIQEYLPEKLESEELLSDQKFVALSKQCYLDVILNIIKLFVLGQVSTSSLKKIKNDSSILIARKNYSALDCFSMQQPLDQTHTKQELVLLFWLQTHFDRMKNVLWTKDTLHEGLTSIQDKKVRMFGPELADSLVFAAVTASYCPYVSSQLEDMYISPSNAEEIFHNACKLITVWNELNFSYDIEPMDIVKPNVVNMLLLTLYLYEVLPSLNPINTLNFEAKLTQQSMIPLTIFNNEHFSIYYKILFLNNSLKAFGCKIEQFKVGPKKRYTVNIIYEAKKIKPLESVLILSGELPGRKYSKSMAMTLKGTPDNNFATKEIELKAAFYELYKLKFKLTSPYTEPDTYDIYYNIREPNEKNFEILNWENYLKSDAPKRMITKKHAITITDPDEGFLFQPFICCVFPATIIYTLYLIGKHGDWSIRVTTIPKLDKRHYEPIDVRVPESFNSQKCICKGELSSNIAAICPKTLMVAIPAKNSKLWKALGEMYTCASDQYDNFWKQHLGTRMGFNILKEYIRLENDKTKETDVHCMFNKSLVYHVKIDKNIPISTVRTLNIDNVLSEAKVLFPIHADDVIDFENESMFIKMECRNDTRIFKLNFSTILDIVDIVQDTTK